MTKSADVLIIGAGIVGAACAFELSREKFSVAVVDAGGIGLGATAAGMGHIVVMDDSEAQFRLTRFSQELWQALAPQLPADCEYRECGTLWVAANDEEMSEVQRKHREYQLKFDGCGWSYNGRFPGSGHLQRWRSHDERQCHR